ncbi:MAG: methyltransferase domain-containing protein [Roseiflexaceae bacterium]
MIKVGHELSDIEIEQRYSAMAGALQLPSYFYPAVAAFAKADSARFVLDVGCGNGELLEALHLRDPGAEYVGVDLSASRVRFAQTRLGTQAALLQIGSGTLPFATESFDLVFVTEVIEHLKNPNQLLDEIYRILAPQGRLILTTPNSQAYPFWPQFAWLAKHSGRPAALMHFLPFEHPFKTRQPIDTVVAFREVQSMLDLSNFVPHRILGRETLPFLFALPGLRGLVYRGWISRPFVDRAFNWLGLAWSGYRTFWDCTKKKGGIVAATP